MIRHCAWRKKPWNGFLLLLKNKALLMRISALAILLSISGMMLAADLRGQDLDKVVISIELKDVTLKRALQKIESAAKISFTYKTDDVAGFSNINYSAAALPVSRILNSLLMERGLMYEQVNTNIIIKKIKRDIPPADVNTADKIANFPFAGSLRGRITDEKGDPLSNSTIELIGTGKGTAANSNGEFSITGIAAGNYKLRVSAIGFQPETSDITIKDNEDLELAFHLKPVIIR